MNNGSALGCLSSPHKILPIKTNSKQILILYVLVQEGTYGSLPMLFFKFSQVPRNMKMSHSLNDIYSYHMVTTKNNITKKGFLPLIAKIRLVMMLFHFIMLF